MNKKYINLAFIFTAIFLALLVGVITYQQQRINQLSSVKSIPSISPVPSISPISSATPNPTASWKIFQQDYREDYSQPIKFNFEFKYPTEWQTEGYPGSKGTYFFIPGQDGPWVMDLNIAKLNGKTIEEFIKRDQFPYEFIKTFNTGTNKGSIVSDPATEGSDYIIAFFKVTDYVVSLGIASNPPKLDVDSEVLLEQILSTFKFSEPKSDLKSDIESWSKYTQDSSSLSWDKCDNEPQASINIKATASSGPVFRRNYNSLNIAYTSNNNYTQSEINQFMLCEAGAYHPIYAFSDKILWVKSCSSGISDDTTQQCESTKTQIEKLYGYQN